jgi:anti-sigma B factor antagonist
MRVIRFVYGHPDRDNAACGAPFPRGGCYPGSGDAARLSLEAAVVVVSDERFPVTWSDRTAVVGVPVELDLTSADVLREALLEVLNAGAAGLVIDMTATTFCDSAGISAITRAARRAAANDATLVLAVTSTPVLRVLNLVGVDRLIDIYPSVSAARASLPDQAGGLIK